MSSESYPASSALEMLTDPKARYKRIFQKYGSVERDGERFMTQDDFVAAIAGDDPKIQHEQFALLFRFADRSHRGLVSTDDFAYFEQQILTKPDVEYEIAFRLFDTQNTGKITFGQFKQALSSFLAPGSAPIDFNSDWMRMFVGGGKKAEDADSRTLTYGEFSQLLKGLQGERLRQQFKRHDPEGTGFISPESFQQIISDVARHKLSDYVIERLPTISQVCPDGIGYAHVLAFHNVIRQLDQIERILREAITASRDGRITKREFMEAAARSTRFSMITPLEADVIFHFAGYDVKDARLNLRDFARLLDPAWRPRVVAEEVKLPKKEPKGFLWDLLESAHSFALGSIAGAVGATVVYPIDLVKTRMQNQRSKVVGEILYKNSWDCFKKVVKNEGLLGLYRGLGPQLVGVAPEKAIKLTVNDLVRGKLKNKDTGEIWWGYEVIAGGTAGGCQVIFTNPLEIVKIRLQIQGEMAKHIEGVPKRSATWIVRNLGIVGLYKGASACLLRDIPFSAIYFPAYAHLKRDVFHEGRDGKKLSIGELLLSGGIAGMPAAYLTTPADVIKTRLQVEARKGQTTYSGITDAARKIMREEGFRAFFKGGVARVLRSSPQFATTLMVYELLQKWLPLKTEAVEKVISPEMRADSDLGPLRSRNAIRTLLDLDYRFGVVPQGVKMPNVGKA
ncbi:uncharacterized protein VTP21DRAFT_242 [Calcarisporiella thermophila]|uniref:uncharacterized protein n=1 Tax=Calcarisporiella thermophila TaxID=911321 RepID=UPI0037434EA1